MSLCCGEHTEYTPHHQDLFLVTDVIFAVQLPGSTAYYAVCQATIDAIPLPDRQSVVVAGGLNVHRGHSTPNYPFLSDQLSLSGFECGDWLFSLTVDSAASYLPRLWNELSHPR